MLLLLLGFGSCCFEFGGSGFGMSCMGCLRSDFRFFPAQRLPSLSLDMLAGFGGCNIGALIIGIGFFCVYATMMIIRYRQNSTSNY